MVRSFYLGLAMLIGMSSLLSAQSNNKAMMSGPTSTGFAMNDMAPKGLDDIYKFYETNFRFVPNLAKVMSSSPALLRSYYDTQNNLKNSGSLSQSEINVVQMSIAVENKCRYCTAGHTMAGKAFFKTPEDVVEAIRARKQMSDPKLSVLRNFAIVVYAKRGEVDPYELNKFLNAGYTRAQALDVVTCVAAKVMSNYTNSLAKTPIDPPLAPLAEGLPFAKK